MAKKSERRAADCKRDPAILNRILEESARDRQAAAEQVEKLTLRMFLEYVVKVAAAEGLTPQRWLTRELKKGGGK